MARWSKFEEHPESPQRRDFMRSAALGAGVAAAGLAGAARAPAAAQTAAAQTATAAQSAAAAAETPIGPQWWPSRWGAEDQAGASNMMTPENTLRAARHISDGKVYRLGRVYEQGMPLFGSRVFAVRIPGGPSGGPFGRNKLVYNDEFVATEIGQVGTQFDGLGHIGAVVGQVTDRADHRFYNGFTGAEVYGPNGLGKLGVEHVKPFFTLAHLVDVEAFRDRMLDAGEEVTLADLRGAMEKQGQSVDDIHPGDGVFFNTGWGGLWMKNNDRFNSGEPGPGLEVGRFLAEKQIAIAGSDTWGTEVVPNPDSELAFPVHNEWMTKNGIFNHENLDFSGLIADGKYRFVYIYAPVPIKGATGSAGSPIAVT